MNKIICKAKKQDLPAILELQKKAFLPVAEIIGNYNIPPLLQTEKELYSEWQTETILACFIEDKLVGSVRGNITNENICYIGKLIVDPDYQNNGIGKALMEAIEREFSNCAKYNLFTGSDTPNTFYLYSKLGYKETERQSNDGVTMIYMEKENPL